MVNRSSYLIISIITLFTLIIAQLSFAPAWSEETVGSSDDVNYFTSIASNSGGHHHIRYRDYSNLDLKYVVVPTSSPIFTINIIDSDTSSVLEGAAVQVDLSSGSFTDGSTTKTKTTGLDGNTTFEIISGSTISLRQVSKTDYFTLTDTAPVAMTAGFTDTVGISRILTTFNFALSVSPQSDSVIRGQAVDAITVIVSLISGSAQNVDLSLAGLPSDVGVGTFSKSSDNPTFFSVLQIDMYSNAPFGVYELIIFGAGGGKDHNAFFELTVSPPPLPPTIGEATILPNPTRINQTITVSVPVTQTSGSFITASTLFYLGVGDSAFTSVVMTASGSTYSGTIPAQAAAGTVSYYINATDSAGNSATSSTASISVTEVPPVRGTVNENQVTENKLTNSSGNTVASTTVGEEVFLQAQVTNNDITAHTRWLIMQVKGPDGAVVSHGSITKTQVTVAAGASLKTLVNFTPQTAGTYTVEVFVFTSLATPISVAPKVTWTFTVG